MDEFWPASSREVRRSAAPPAGSRRVGTGFSDDPVEAPRANEPSPSHPLAAGKPGQIRVVIVDDHASFAGALAMAIDLHPDMRCVGIAESMEAGLAKLARLRPDVVLLDVVLPDANGIDALPSIRAAVPTARVVILTGNTNVNLLAKAAEMGASGFLPKESPVAAVIGVIREAVSGRMLVDLATLAAILGTLADTNPRPLGGVALNAPTLTKREAEVLGLMGLGMNAHTIARRLGIRVNTCRGYQQTMMGKLGAHSQLEAVVIGTRLGLLAR